MEKIIYKDESYKIIGACMEVHTVLGSGFLESVYKDALELEFVKTGISFEREKEYYVDYKGTVLKHKYFADFILFDKIILEVKGISALSDEHIAQCMNYLKVSGCKLAILVNFGEVQMKFRRIVF
jgi:GxxExxY protein